MPLVVQGCIILSDSKTKRSVIGLNELEMRGNVVYYALKVQAVKEVGPGAWRW